MKTSSTHLFNHKIPNLFINDDCDCLCHYPEDIDINDKNTVLSKPLITETYPQSPFKKNYFKKKILIVFVYVIRSVLVLVISTLVYVVHASKKKRLIITKIYILK